MASPSYSLSSPVDATNLAVAHGAFDALQEGDFERFASYFSEKSAGWHNFAPWDKPLSVVVDRLKQARVITRAMKYEDRRYIAVPGGVVAQHTSRRERTDGTRTEMHAMMRIFIEQGLITRIEEYFDPMQTGGPVTFKDAVTETE